MPYSFLLINKIKLINSLIDSMKSTPETGSHQTALSIQHILFQLLLFEIPAVLQIPLWVLLECPQTQFKVRSLIIN